MNDAYPDGPAAVPTDLTAPTPAYKRRAWLALASLSLFVVLYVLLAAWFLRTTYRMFSVAAAGGKDSLWFVLIGTGAAFLTVFMLKALVFLRRGEAPDAIEVTSSDQPRLFEFLHRLADEAGAPRPARVFLSARVNAAVFYDLSLINLLIPSRKNLEIGLALVNVLTLSELKAVLAHEFGHFAQRSMAIGSWVYIAHQIAAHIVAKRDALDKVLRFLSGVDIRVAWIGWLLSLIVWSIRSLMDTLLHVVLLAQRALSRQMEFQADLVAVSLTGSDELVHALHKLHAADDAWGRALGFLQAEVSQGQRPHDLFAVQTRIIDTVGRILDDETYGRVPPPAGVEKPETRRVFKTAFAQPPQMWSTHPANADREENAKQRYLPAPHDARSAWVLFDGIDSLKDRVMSHLTGEAQLEPRSETDTFESLNARYARLQYEPRFRGAYLGRPLARHATRPEALYEATLRNPAVREALESLYPEKLADDLDRVRDLAEERALLEALRDRTFKATGGEIVFRGERISRGALPAAIREVLQEEESVRERVLAHDRACRSAHLAAAEQIGGGWKAYLQGLIATMHYAEHTLADLEDSHGLFLNVLAVVTADGKVSSRELTRLVAAANQLRGVLAGVYGNTTSVQPDAVVLDRLGIPGWAEALGEFHLPDASKDNMNEWISAVGDWVEAATGGLSALAGAATEQLLLSEDVVARAVREGAMPDPAPAPASMPASYPTLVPGNERKRQTRLGLWDRFQTADGLVPAVARLVVAVSIVGVVLGAGSYAASSSTLSIYNGLGIPAKVRIGEETIIVSSYGSRTLDVELGSDPTVSASTTDGIEIESFTPYVDDTRKHHIYNVAAASPLVEWSVAYGSATEQPVRFLGATRWTTSDADYVFNDPPQQLKTKEDGAVRKVLSGLGSRPPEEVLGTLSSEEEQRQVAALHARWDGADAPHRDVWRSISAQFEAREAARAGK